jgi:hypothetical protein
MTIARNHLALLSTAVFVALSGCGGGGGGDAPAPAPAASTLTLTGVAASGAAFTEAVVTVTDSRGVVVGTSSALGSTGAYNIVLAAGAQAPFVIKATRSNASGGTDTLVSVLAAAGTGTVNVNVTPITTLIAARLSPSGNPLSLAAELLATPSTITADKVATRLAEVKEILTPVLAATGTTAFDPLTGSFTADGTGPDRALDVIAVNITPASSSTSNIEIQVKSVVADGAQPPLIHFTNATPIADIKTANAAVINSTINSADLVPAGTSVLIQEFLARWTACHALPLDTRIAANGSTAADITATACRTLFVNDDPATFLSNGNVVGKGKAFNGMFVNGGTGVTFSQGSYEFTRANGDVVIGYRSRTSAGAEANDVVVVRKVGSALKLIGNQYLYPGAVEPYMQRRAFPTRNQSQYNYVSTGYVVNVANTTSNGVPIFDRVEITSPGRSVPNIVLRPSAGHEVLRIVKNATVTSTSYVRINSAFENTATVGTPESIDSPTLVFANPAYTEAAIANLAPQSLWKFDYYLASAPGTLAATQYFRTRARALTLAEFRTKPLAGITSQQLATISSTATGGGSINLSGLAGYGVAWDVPTGALPPTQLSLFGVKYTSETTTVSFNDTATVPSTSLSGSIACSSASVGDLHCGTTVGTFGASTYATGLHLLARDGAGRDLVNFYATYTVPATQ